MLGEEKMKVYAQAVMAEGRRLALLPPAERLKEMRAAALVVGSFGLLMANDDDEMSSQLTRSSLMLYGASLPEGEHPDPGMSGSHSDSRTTLGELTKPLHLVGTDAKSAIFAFIRGVDLAFIASIDARAPFDRSLPIYHCIARCVEALAPLVQPTAQLDIVKASARDFIEHPTDIHYFRIVNASTATYPFGPGDGNQSVAELGGYGVAGNGHRSGIGFVASVGHQTDFDRVRNALQAEFPGDGGA